MSAIENPYAKRPYTPGTGRWLRLAQEGRDIRGTPIARPSLPFRPYVYRGTGQDTLTAWMDDLPDEPQESPPGRRAVQPCGTRAAYKRHLRHGERPCDDCRHAEARRMTTTTGRAS